MTFAIFWILGGLLMLAAMLWAYKGDDHSRIITVKTRRGYREDE